MRRLNPPWSANLLYKHWARIRERVGDALMPVAMTEPSGLARKRAELASIADALQKGGHDADWAMELQRRLRVWSNDVAKLERKRSGFGFKEFGSGHYGVVMPTNTPGIVCKVTTDKSEAAFIAAYLSIKVNARPYGIVRYHQLFALPESSKGRPVFILWRDEAADVGVDAIYRWVRARNDADYLSRSLRTVEREIGHCLDAGRAIRQRILAVEKRNQDPIAFAERAESLRDRAFEFDYPPQSRMGADLVTAWHMNKFKQAADDMTGEPMGIEVGRALGEMMDMGMILADVHLGNIGMPMGAIYEQIGNTPIITDPGHAIPLNRQFEHVRVEQL
jgi:hypothetical protein